MSALEMAHAASPESRAVCGVECKWFAGTSYRGVIGQLTLLAHLGPHGVYVLLYRDDDTLAVGRGDTLAEAERAMEDHLRRRTAMLADASLTMAARGAL